MFAVERIKKIKEMLLEYKHVDVNTLASLLSCSIATIRRDLDKLESEGFLKKAYGGAILKESLDQHVVINSANDPYYEDKVQIGLIADEMIGNDDIIFLGPGLTCLQIAKNIKQKKLTVVTTNISILLELSNLPEIEVIIPGGDLVSQNDGLFLTGQYALNNLHKMYINKSFFSVDGISMEYGYTVNYRQQAELIQTLLKQSNDSIAVADLSKFNRRAFTQVCSILEIKNLITNVGISTEYKEFLFNSGINLFTTFEENH